MSYSNDVKNELTRILPANEYEEIAQLAGIIRVNGTILISSGQQFSLKIISENASVARLVYTKVKSIFRMETNIVIQRHTRLKKNIRYIVNIPSQAKMKTFLETIGMVSEEGIPFNPMISKDFTTNDSNRRAYIRGIFLGSGSVTDPQRNYHLEIVVQSEEFANSFIELLKTYDINIKMSYRKESLILYLKESELISDFLALIGAHDAVMILENVRIKKNMRNQVNRLVNCETANLSKSVDAAMRQCQFIQLIKDNIGLDNLSENLRQTAQARLDHPEASLKELGRYLDPPVGKSGINHRMRRLEEMAEPYLASLDQVRELK